MNLVTGVTAVERDGGEACVPSLQTGGLEAGLASLDSSARELPAHLEHLMAELKTKPTRKSVAVFLQSIGDAQQRKDAKVLAAMFRRATGARAEMWGPAIVGFGRATYAGSRGTSMEWFEAGFSPRAGKLSLYLMSGLQPHTERLAALGAHKTGKGCLYIRRLSDVDSATLEQLVAESITLVRARAC